MFTGLGISLFLTGLVIVALAWVVLRMLPSIRPSSGESDEQIYIPETVKTNEATLVLQTGGRVEYISRAAREYFGQYAGYAQEYLFYYSRCKGVK